MTAEDISKLYKDPIGFAKEKKLHGKIVLNCNAGDIPTIEVDERINKPKEVDRELE